MKISLVHDWLISFAGAERVSADILRIWPDADLFSVVDFLSDSDRTHFLGKYAKTTFIQRLLGAKHRHRLYLPLMPFAVEQLDLSGYDVVISSSHAVAKGILVGPDQLHICYCHSPIRYAWDMQHQYLRESRLDSGLKGILARWMLYRIRNWDHRTSNGVDFFISNSDYIGRRIQKVYRRDSTTIYPNVAVEDFPLVSEKSDFYLTASRLVPYKQIGLIVRSFAGMPDRKLVVIGDGPEYARIKAQAPANVTMMGYQSFEVLRDHMQRARAFIFAAEEDFGIVPVEAQACGTPVIAFGKGGALETVLDGVTGMFFREQSESAIQQTVSDFESNFVADPVRIRFHAEQFSSERFRAQMKAFVEEKYQQFISGKL
ncbi:glycosyltransferase family 4 protein [Castellaniella sp. S9]|uniref:glycosyltransferase family 4 protein n=1 Tax=Castellaniella sp. S9 TaxID=2993652 RepID=UPI0022B326B9|nr:glycosyltransferase family 4 protein [Castellaniella sp. S9]